MNLDYENYMKSIIYDMQNENITEETIKVLEIMKNLQKDKNNEV